MRGRFARRAKRPHWLWRSGAEYPTHPPSRQGRDMLGVQGGDVPPCQTAMLNAKHRVGWLRTSKRVQSQPFGRPRKATLGTARNCGHPTVAGKLPGPLAVCLDDGDDDGRPVTLWLRRARCRAPEDGKAVQPGLHDLPFLPCGRDRACRARIGKTG